MSDMTPSDKRLGLHEQAISAVLILMEQRRFQQATVDEVALAIDTPIERLRRLFPDDDALLIASIEQALVVLMDVSRRAVVQVDPDDALAQFTALADAYLDWAAVHHVQFRILSDCDPAFLLQTVTLKRYIDGMTDLMTRMMTRARDDGRLHPREDIPLLVLSARSYAYGLARMIVDGRMQDWAPDRDPVVMAKELSRDFVLRIARSSRQDPSNT